MSAPKLSFDPPISAPVSGSDGRASEAFQKHFDHVAKTLEILRQAAGLMDSLAASPTNSDIATAWNEFRAKLQEIT